MESERRVGAVREDSPWAKLITRNIAVINVNPTAASA